MDYSSYLTLVAYNNNFQAQLWKTWFLPPTNHLYNYSIPVYMFLYIDTYKIFFDSGFWRYVSIWKMSENWIFQSWNIKINEDTDVIIFI